MVDKAKIKRVLTEKQQQLRQEIARLENEARESAGADVEDPIDLVTSTEAKAALSK